MQRDLALNGGNDEDQAARRNHYCDGHRNLRGTGQVKMPNIKQQATPQAVLDEHLDALNKCDWERLISQYPDDAQINLPNGAIVKGRPAIADLFARTELECDLCFPADAGISRRGARSVGNNNLRCSF